MGTPNYKLQLGSFAAGFQVKAYVLTKAKLQSFVDKTIPLSALTPTLILPSYVRSAPLLVPAGSSVLVAGNQEHAVAALSAAKPSTTWGNEPILSVTTNSVKLNLIYATDPRRYLVYAIVQPVDAYDLTVDPSANSKFVKLAQDGIMYGGDVDLSDLPAGDYIIWIGTRLKGDQGMSFNRVNNDPNVLGTILNVHRP